MRRVTGVVVVATCAWCACGGKQSVKEAAPASDPLAPADATAPGDGATDVAPPVAYTPLHRRSDVEPPPLDAVPPELRALTIDVTFEPAPAEDAARRRIRLEQVAMLRKLIDATPAGDPDRNDLLMRAGDILATEALALRRDGHAPEARSMAAAAAKVLAELVPDARYGRRDQALILLARMQLIGGDEAGARVAMQTLVKDLPASRYVPNCYLIFADWLRAAGQPVEAAAFYDKAAQFEAAAAPAVYALLQRGRLRMEAEDLPRALGDFVRARELGRAPALAALQQAAIAATDRALLRESRQRHAAWLRERTPANLDAARVIYGKVLKMVSRDNPDHAATAYYLAELAWSEAAAETDAGRALPLWTEAAAVLGRAGDDPGTPEPLRAEAARAAAMAADNAAAVRSP